MASPTTLAYGYAQTVHTTLGPANLSEAPLAKPLGYIVCGDVLHVLARVPLGSVHVIITSPPYNLEKPYSQHDDGLEDREYLAWMKQVWGACKRVLVPGGRICVNIGENKRQYISNPHYSAFIQQLVELRMLYRGTIIWNKHSAAKHCAWGSWKSPSNPHLVPRHEYIIVFSKGDWKLEGRPEDVDITPEEFMACTRSVWEFGTESRTRIGHPAPFPEQLPERLIKFLSFRGQTVLDPFAGSGTVGLVAARLGRHFILGDNSPQYCKLARKRIVAELGLLHQPRIISVGEL
ncbi:MAG: site-specific DNA-methyltransferase [Planctomycetes bacterium]|nr:site-specific DNA-methyltransferase [Planctomycetota bacterium]